MTVSRDLRPLLEPESIVVVGASEDSVRIGGRPLQLARMHGFAGLVAGVNPKYSSVQGYPCYPDLASVPFVPDLAILAIAARDVMAALEAAVARGVRAVVIFAGGFAELGTPAGRALQEDVKQLARKSDLLIAGPNAIGLVNVRHGLYATFMTAMVETPPKLGNVAIIAQSGGAVIAVHNTLHARGVGLRYLLNTGNEACVDFSDYLEHVASDPETRVIAGYIEGLDDGDRLIAQLQMLRDRGLPIVLYKVGETAAGADAAASHTARLAGSHAVFKAAFRQLGVLRADDMEQLAELAYLATFARRCNGTRAGVLTTSGAFAAILADKFGPAGVTVPVLSHELQDQLRPDVPTMAITANPVDITANVVNTIGGFGRALDRLLATDELDFVILFSTSNLVDKLADEILRAASASDRLLAVMVTGNCTSQASLEAAGISVFHDIGRGASAIASLAVRSAEQMREGRWRRDPAKHSTKRPSHLADLVASARRDSRLSLSESEGKAMLASFDVPVTGDVICHDREAAAAEASKLGFPVVMKILSPDIAHKTEVGGVRLGLANIDEVRSAYDAMRSDVARRAPDARVDGIVLQRQIKAGVELLVSVRRDPLFGPVLTLGIGGTATELINDVQLALLPIDSRGVHAMIRQLRMGPLLTGYRNQPGCNLEAVVSTVLSIIRAAEALGDELDEIEVNPLIVEYGDQGSVVAVDCVTKILAAAADGMESVR